MSNLANRPGNNFSVHFCLMVSVVILLSACDTKEPCSGVTASRYTFQAKIWPSDKSSPTTLNSAHDALANHLGEQQKQLLQCLPVARAEVHMGLSLWIRNNWDLYGNSPLKDELAKLGLKHVDDMSNVVAWTYINKLRGKSTGLENELGRYQ